MSDKTDSILPEENSELENILGNVLGSRYEELNIDFTDRENALEEIRQKTGYRIEEIPLIRKENESIEEEGKAPLKVYEEGMEIEGGDRILVPVFVMYDAYGKTYLNAGRYPYVANTPLHFIPDNITEAGLSRLSYLQGRKIYVIVNVKNSINEYSYEISLESSVVLPQLSPTDTQIQNMPEQAKLDYEEYEDLCNEISELKRKFDLCLSYGYHEDARKTFANARRLPLQGKDYDYFEGRNLRMPENERSIFYGDGSLANRIDMLTNNAVLVESLNKQEFLDFASLVANGGVLPSDSDSHGLLVSTLKLLKESNIENESKVALLLYALNTRVKKYKS